MRQITRQQARTALTMIELVVVLASVSVLVALLVCAIQQVRESANRTRCVSNLRQIGLALQQHLNATQVYPSNGGWDGQQSILTTTGQSIHTTVTESIFHLTFTWGVGEPALAPQQQTGSWAYAILPYLEQELMYQQRDWSDPMALYLCPSRGRPGSLPAVNDQHGVYDGGGWSWGRTDYAANALTIPNRPHCLSINAFTDGTSNTILAGEKAMSPASYATGTWYWDEPFFVGGSGGTQRGFGTRGDEGLEVLQDTNDPSMPYRYNWGSAHAQAAHFLFADGSVRSIAYGTPPATMAALLTPNGGEAVPHGF